MPKSYGRNERIAASLRREAAHILSSEIKDPRVRLATVTEVNVSPDLRNATIFVSFMDDDDAKIKEAMTVLNKAAGFVRSTMASRLKMRYMPNIHFEFDRLVRDSMKLDALIAGGLGPKDETVTMAEAAADLAEDEADAAESRAGDAADVAAAGEAAGDKAER